MIAWRGAWDTPESTALTAVARPRSIPPSASRCTLQRNVQQDSPFIFVFQAAAQAVLRANVHGFVSAPSFDLVFHRDVTKS